MYPLIIVIIVCAVSAAVVISIVIYKSARPSDAIKDRIVHDLSNKGYQMIDIKIPGSFSKRPTTEKPPGFTWMKPMKKGIQQRIKYRVVRYRDKNGLIRQSWIKIHATAFDKEEVTWLPEI